ncbi:MAG: hypothetical protein ACOCQ6_02600 [Bacteroidota bacterium]
MAAKLSTVKTHTPNLDKPEPNKLQISKCKEQININQQRTKQVYDLEERINISLSFEIHGNKFGI